MREDYSDNNLVMRALFDNQRDLSRKFDDLQAYIRDHMEKEEKEIGDIRVDVATLKEKVSGQGRKWGAVATVITSVISALSVTLFTSHK